jgi:hypothetical protein
LFEKINNIDRPLANMTEERKNPKSVKLEMQRGDNNKHHGKPGNHQQLL